MTGKKPRVLVVAPDPLGMYGAGVRAYHFARRLAEAAELHLVVLDKSELQPMSMELRERCASVLELPNGSPSPRRGGGMRAAVRKARKICSVLVCPWRRQGRDLLHAAVFHGHHPTSRSSRGLGHLARRVYVRMLEAEVAAGTWWFGLQPARSVERALAFDRLRPIIQQRWSGKRFDVVWFENSYLFPQAIDLRASFPGAVLVCNAHNVEYSLHQRLGDIAVDHSLKRWFRVQASAMRNLERRAFSASLLTFACSKDDERLIHGIAPQACTAVVPNGVDVDYFRARGDRAQEPRLLFPGTMSYRPNQDAVAWFVRDILPLILRRVPECRFCIAGLAAKANFGHLPETMPYVEIASDVPDMRPYYEQASVVVVPLRAGSGVRTKIQEAMSMGRAVVSTTLGAEGIELTPERHLRLADEPVEFAARVVELLQSPGRRHELEKQGRELVCAKFDWKMLTAGAIRVFEERLARPTCQTADRPSR
jgi:glycosyltransferase involved in cell wall biosynthesis